jgi:SIR2-like domain
MTQDADFASQKFAIYILGAGFSKPAGLPLACELWDEVRRRALSLSGRAECFRDDLETYLEYRRKCDGKELTFEQVDLEEFMAFLDIEFHLGLRGKETWSSDGNETQVVVKTLIGEILTEKMPVSIPEQYLAFARLLKPDDYVLTFNYDVLLERALESAGIPFRLYPDRYKPNPFGGGMLIDTAKKEVMVLKLHGSIDWFDRTHYGQLEENRIRQGFAPGGSDLIFKEPQRFGAAPLLEGPRFPDDPLRQMHRVKDIERLYRTDPLFLATPSLLNPSSMKILYSQMVRDFWWGLGYVGAMNFRMAIIGFSLPSQDEYARQVIYRLVKNYQSISWDETWDSIGHKKTPLVLVDFRSTAQEEQVFLQRYAFVDWSKAQTCFSGFDENALGILGRT